MQTITLRTPAVHLVHEVQLPDDLSPVAVVWQLRVFLRVSNGYREIPSYAIPDTS